MSKSRWVVVDDTSVDIHYSGSSTGWFTDVGSQDQVGYAGPAYRSTLHGTQSSASLSFSFSGTSVSAFGLNNVRNDSGTIDPQWECTVDQKSITVASPSMVAANNWELCSDLDLADGPHTLTINVTVSHNQTFWLDSIQYIPSAGASLANKDLRVEETDSAFLYDTGWSRLPDRGVLVTSKTGSVLHFQFVGTSLAWIGTTYANITGVNSSGTFAVDGGNYRDFDLLDGRVFPAEDKAGQRLFETPTLSLEKHDLAVQYFGNSESAPLLLEHLFVQNGTLLLSAGPLQWVTPSSTQPSSGPISSPTTSQDVHGSTTPKKRSATAVIAGVVSVVIAILLLVVVLLFWKRRRVGGRSKLHPFPSAGPTSQAPYIPHHPSLLHSATHNRLEKHAIFDAHVSSQTLARPLPFVAPMTPPNVGNEGMVDQPHLEKARTVDEFRSPQRPSLVPPTAPPSFMTQQSEPVTSLHPVRETAPYEDVPASRQTQLQPSVEEMSHRVIRHEDSGVRGSNIGVVPLLELPPVYTPG